MQGDKGTRQFLIIIVSFTLLLQLILVRDFFIKTDPVYLGILPQWPLALFTKRLIFGVLMVGLAALGFLKNNTQKPVFLLLLLCALAIAANNLCFIQVWLFLHLSFLFALVFAGTGKEALWCIRAMIISMYVFSGISKINVHYASHFFPFFFGRHVPFEPMLAYATALFEILLALGLLYSKTNYLSKAGLVLLHTWLLLSLRNNNVVYPWNVEMMLLALAAFPRGTSLFSISLRSVAVMYTIVFFLIHPIIQQTGKGLFSLGFNMYYFAQPRGYILLSGKAASKLPQPFKGYLAPKGGKQQFSIDGWLSRQYNVPVVATELVYKNVLLYFCNDKAKTDLQLKIVRRQRFRYEPETEYMRCSESGH